jgi:hypothetical protein
VTEWLASTIPYPGLEVEVKCVCAATNLQATLAEVRALTIDLRVETAVRVERDGCRPGRDDSEDE